jgi:hypothetical protein
VNLGHQLLLVGAVTAVGVLHTLVPDHWLPIAVVARQRHWTRAQTARAAAIAGFGHTASTLGIGVIVWFAGLTLAMRFGNLVSLLSGIALVAFGLWMAIGAIREMHLDRRQDESDMVSSRGRTGLLLILGSSPMVEGLPAFFAAGKFGAGLLAVMAGCFALSTVATYVALCVSSHRALDAVAFGPFERYGEVLSGTIVAIVGVVFLFWMPA